MKAGEKRQAYFGSKATKTTWGVLPSPGGTDRASPGAVIPRVITAIRVSRLWPPTASHLPDALWVLLDSTNCAAQILRLPGNWAGNCTTPNEVCPQVPAAHLLKAERGPRYRSRLLFLEIIIIRAFKPTGIAATCHLHPSAPTRSSRVHRTRVCGR